MSTPKPKPKPRAPKPERIAFTVSGTRDLRKEPDRRKPVSTENVGIGVMVDHGALGTIEYAIYRELERRITAADDAGLDARWEFGRGLLKQRKGKKLPDGLLDAITKDLGVSSKELQRRMRFAEKYPSEKALRHAVSEYGSWHRLVEEGLYDPAPPKLEVVPDIAPDETTAEDEPKQRPKPFTEMSIVEHLEQARRDLRDAASNGISLESLDRIQSAHEELSRVFQAGVNGGAYTFLNDLEDFDVETDLVEDLGAEKGIEIIEAVRTRKNDSSKHPELDTLEELIKIDGKLRRMVLDIEPGNDLHCGKIRDIISAAEACLARVYGGDLDDELRDLST